MNRSNWSYSLQGLLKIRFDVCGTRFVKQKQNKNAGNQAQTINTEANYLKPMSKTALLLAPKPTVCHIESTKYGIFRPLNKLFVFVFDRVLSLQLLLMNQTMFLFVATTKELSHDLLPLKKWAVHSRKLTRKCFVCFSNSRTCVHNENAV